MWVAERAVSPITGTVTYLLIDDGDLRTQPEVRSFVLYLLGSGRSPETMRAYIPRLGRFLNWCESQAVDFKRVTVLDLSCYKHDLQSRPSQRGRPLITGKTVNAHLTAVLEFLRFAASYELIEPSVVEKLSRRGFVSSHASSFDPGENGQFRVVSTPVVKAPEITLPPATLSNREVERLISSCRTARDRFLVVLLASTGMRIGEALGLRREDLHLLPDSSIVGCQTRGAHAHVVPRQDNQNGARAKSGRARSIPVTDDLVEVYRDHRLERDQVRGAELSDYIFVNLVGANGGRPLSYSNVFQVLRRAAARGGLKTFHPHLLRHTAGTRWIRAGVAPDVVQELLGHASAASTAIYVHATSEDKRAAVERVASVIREGKSQ